MVSAWGKSRKNRWYLFKTKAGNANMISPPFSWRSFGKGQRATSSNSNNVIKHEASYLTDPPTGASNACRDKIMYTEESCASLWRHLTLYSASKRKVFKHGETRSSFGLTTGLIEAFPSLRRHSWRILTSESSAFSSSNALCQVGSEILKNVSYQLINKHHLLLRKSQD